MDILQTIGEISKTSSNPYLETQKTEGRKIVGYFCHIPVEIIHASGMVPYRMRAVGSLGTTKGDIYFSPLNCTFVRHCFDKALRGDFDFLDAVIFMNGCDHTRRMYDNWRYVKESLNISPDFLYMFIAPHYIDENSLGQYVSEIKKFREVLRKRFDTAITDEELLNSIKLYNKNRKLLSKIYAKRKSQNIFVQGSDILSMMLAVTAMPVEAANELLERFDSFIDDKVSSSKCDIRILLTGGCMEEIGIIKTIESLGAVVVADNLCFGARYFDMEVDESGDPIESIAKRYLNKLSCPRMVNDFDRRMKYIYDTIREHKIDAVITQKLKFCDLWGVENLMIMKESKKNKFPLLVLERELYGKETGQLKTRIQAFIEKVRNMKKAGMVAPE